MRYVGKLYGKIGRKYFQLDMTSDDVEKIIAERDALRQQVDDLESYIERYREDMV